MIANAKLAAALKARKAYISDNIETLTLKQVRRLLEKDLGLDSRSLDAQKDAVKSHLDEILKEIDEQATKAPAAPAAPASKSKAPAPKREATARAAAPAPSKLSAAVQKMKKICQTAGIGVGPNIYKKADVRAAFEELLAKHGLRPSSDATEIANVKKKLDEQRDMDGIDMSNIVEGGRRKRQAPQPSKAAAPRASPLGEDGENDDRDVDEPRRASKPSKKRQLNDDDDDDDGDDDEPKAKVAVKDSSNLTDAGARDVKAPSSKQRRVVLDDDDDDDFEDVAGVTGAPKGGAQETSSPLDETEANDEDEDGDPSD